MNAKAWWLVEGRVIYIKLAERLSIKDFQALDEQVITLLKAAASAQVHFVVDVTALNAIPPINDLGKLQHLRHFRYGWLITVGAQQKPAINAAFALLAQMFKVRTIALDTLESALRYLYNVEPTLNEEESITNLYARII
jgi:hypothetical protein